MGATRDISCYITYGYKEVTASKTQTHSLHMGGGGRKRQRADKFKPSTCVCAVSYTHLIK